MKDLLATFVFITLAALFYCAALVVGTGIVLGVVYAFFLWGPFLGLACGCVGLGLLAVLVQAVVTYGP